VAAQVGDVHAAAGAVLEDASFGGDPVLDALRLEHRVFHREDEARMRLNLL
jgi:hypothetical protein